MRMLMIAALAALPTLAIAADDPMQNTLEARHGYFKMMGMNMGKLSAMAKGEMPYDEAAAATAAKNLEALSHYDATTLFVEGTANGELDDSEASTKIWEDPEGFGAKFVAFREAVAGAGEAVMGGQENVGPVLQKIGGTCKACHDDYRVE